MSDLLAFPHPVNEKAARSVAAGVVMLTAITLLTQAWWLTVPLALGFWARVLTGPTLSPLGQLATRAIAPRLGAPHYVSGPPKRFAQGVGAALTTVAAVLALSGHHTAAGIALGAVIVAALLESVFALCLGCKLFGLLMRAGVIPSEVCAECADIWSRPPGATA
ncbi:MAG: hypothetical protein QOK21_668 [Solirubrobacteraceae bacterium]|jgi:hypothetical protein|nr:hypothetical protein [Solirubrobacteraceae bacterium]